MSKTAQDFLESARILIEASKTRGGDPMKSAVHAFNVLSYRDLTDSEGWLLKSLYEIACAVSTTPTEPHIFVEATRSVAKLGQTVARDRQTTFPGIPS